jgi:1-acyl-sn-glycerol-3-phosphate acyltransferase
LEILYISDGGKNMSRRNYLYKFARSLVRLYSSLMLKMDVFWHASLPEGPKIFVANHPSATDPFIIHLLSSEGMSVLITGNAFTFPLLGLYLRHTGQIPVVFGQGAGAIEKARRLLDQGHSVGIFPEGQFSPRNGGFRKPHIGVAHLALFTGAPVIPIGIYLPRERCLKITTRHTGRKTTGFWYLFGPYGITVGKPMRFKGDTKSMDRIQYVAENIMKWIRSLARESEIRINA